MLIEFIFIVIIACFAILGIANFASNGGVNLNMRVSMEKDVDSKRIYRRPTNRNETRKNVTRTNNKRVEQKKNHNKPKPNNRPNPSRPNPRKEEVKREHRKKSPTFGNGKSVTNNNNSSDKTPIEKSLYDKLIKRKTTDLGGDKMEAKRIIDEKYRVKN